MDGAGASSEALRYAEYARGPTGAGKGQTELDRRLARSMIAVGLGVATVAFAGRYAFHLWKPLGQAITETAKKISTSSLSLYYKGGFEQKMSRREASLILGVSPSADKAKIRAAHRRIMILNHPDKGAPGEGICASMLPLQLFCHGQREKCCLMSSAAEFRPRTILNMWHCREICLVMFSTSFLLALVAQMCF
ncbi:dnaJ homolog subfamily C member 15 isoform X2 [Tympanuchus pallidicinctus]|uniref:dnaJ homolog subfamily C member 15 isoform X2 n=1 Tax=Tympanuchus pallidicinctus TaxID=109042 RepID=UPI002286F98C|nr:dnaJ homolog subfamily C member 15 isoform X2 [Tympanuchus pallidicinctus]